MSLEAAAEFLKCISEDEALTAKVESSGKDEVLELARSLGYEMSLSEFKRVLEKVKKVDNDELSNEDMEQVTGGIAVLGAIALGCTIVTAGIKLYQAGEKREWW